MVCDPGAEQMELEILVYEMEMLQTLATLVYEWEMLQETLVYELE